MTLIRRTKKLTIVLAIITLIAGLFFIAGLNKMHPAPFSFQTERTYVDKIFEDGNGGVAIDFDKRQLLFLDSEGRVINIVDVTKSGSPINRIYNGCLADGQVKIHGSMAKNNGTLLSSESIVAYNMQGNLISEELKREYSAEERVTCSQLNLAEVYAGKNVIFGEQVSELTLEYSVWYVIGNLAFWVSCVWVFAVALALVIWFIAKKLRKKGLIVAISILAILITAAFYTYNMNKQLENTYRNTIITLTKSIEMSLQGKLDVGNTISAADKASIADILNNEKVVAYIEELNNEVNVICNSSEVSFAPVVNIGIMDGENTLYSLIDSTQQLSMGTQFTLNQELKNQIFNHDICTTANTNSANGDFIYDISTLKTEKITTHDGAAELIIRVGYYRDNLIANQLETAVNLFVSLLAIFIALYVLVELVLAYKREIKNRKKEENKLDKVAHMSGAYTFIYKMADKIDGAIMVYVAVSMCASEDPFVQAILAAIPMAAWSVGRWIGAFLAAPIIKRFGERLVGIVTSLAGVVIMLLMAYSVIDSNILLYSIGKGFWGLFMGGIMYILSDNMPLSATTDKGKALAIDSVQQSTMAAYIISVLIGGYISEFISYSTIYFVGAAICVPMLGFSLYIFGSKKTNMAANSIVEDKHSMRKYWKIFLKSEMIMYSLFYMLPCMLIGGYGGYLFPLYSNGAGISALLLSNINVIATALVYALGKPISEFVLRADKRKMLVVPNLAICAGLICFILSPNIYWAIVMLFAYLILDRMTRVGSKMYVVDVARKYELNEKTLASNSITVNTAIFAFQSPALSAFVGLGMNIACAAVGGVSAIMLWIFGMYNRRQRYKNLNTVGKEENSKQGKDKRDDDKRRDDRRVINERTISKGSVDKGANNKGDAVRRGNNASVQV